MSIDESDQYHINQQYIGILQLMIQYQFETGKFPIGESLALYEYIRESKLLADVSWYQLKTMIWLLKETFQIAVKAGGEKLSFDDPCLEKRFELSKEIWGGRSFQEEDDDQDDDEECVFIHPHTKLPVTLTMKKRGCLDHRNSQDDDYNQEGAGENEVVFDPRDEDFQHIAILKSILYFYHNNGMIPPAGCIELHDFVSRSVLKREISRSTLVDRIFGMEDKFRNITEVMGTYDINLLDPLEQEIYDLSRQIWGDQRFQDGDWNNGKKQEDDSEYSVDEDNEDDHDGAEIW